MSRIINLSASVMVKYKPEIITLFLCLIIKEMRYCDSFQIKINRNG